MNSKVLLIVAICMSAFGFIVMATGLSLGAKPVINVDKSSQSGNKEVIHKTVDLDEFDKLEVDIASIGVYLEQGDSYKLEYQAYEDNVPKISQDGKKLTVKQPSHHGFRFGLMNISGEDEQYYKITVPKDAGVIDVNMDAASGLIHVDSVDIEGNVDIASGLVQVSNTTSDELKFSAASGKIELDNITTKKLVLDLTSGMINLEDCTTKELDTELSSGTITIDKMAVDKADFDITSGKVALNVLGKKDDYSYKLEATSGSINVDGASVGKSLKTNDDKEKEIEADLTSGSFEVTFAE